MKHLFITLIIILSFNSFAGESYADKRMRAFEIIDRGDYSEIYRPYIVGCAAGECYGGLMSWNLKPTFRAKRICKMLGFRKAVRGSKLVEVKEVSTMYGALTYHLIYRSGTPGAEEATFKKLITYVECMK
jgi:hypothetical protein